MIGRQARADARVKSRPFRRVIPLRASALALATPVSPTGRVAAQRCASASPEGGKSHEHDDPAQSEQPVSGAFRVDVSRGQRIGRVSSEWFSRPDDERYLSFSELHKAVEAGRNARRRGPWKAGPSGWKRPRERLALTCRAGTCRTDRADALEYGQLCTLVGAPTSYMRQLPAPLVGINLQHGLLSHRAELVKTLEADNGRIEIRAVTGPEYGRIWDHELVAAVMKIAGNGTGDTSGRCRACWIGAP